jgi:hypothetical protein
MFEFLEYLFDGSGGYSISGGCGSSSIGAYDSSLI